MIDYVLGVFVMKKLLLIFCLFLLAGCGSSNFLIPEGGSVFLDCGDGWEAVNDRIPVSLDCSVKTDVGKATVVLHESVLVQLDADTEVSLADLAKEHVIVKQKSGVTWNKFTGLLGVGDYAVVTPNTAAIVKGTFFRVSMDDVLVLEGEVLAKGKGGEVLLKAGEKLDTETFEKVPMTAEDKRRSREQLQRDIDRLKDLREKVLDDHPVLVKAVKVKTGMSDDELRSYLDRADDGEFDLDELIDKSPVQTDALDQLKALTQEIIDNNKVLAGLG